MNRIVPLVVTVQTFVLDRVERLAERNDRGVSALEYGGLALFVGTIFTAIFKVGIPGKVGGFFTTALGSIFGAK